MSNRYVMEALLRPAVELYSAAAGGAATFDQNSSGFAHLALSTQYPSVTPVSDVQ
ncbi:Uncharacterised protein [Salmonella enterica subsp. enterica serovar Typhi]|nr:Uncharacterised protein [Salmonella enterica subsp. enterica serovar Typhi]